VFIDESGLSQRPHRCRTWSPKGQTPVLQYSFNWKKLSAVAGITWWNFYFQLHAGSIRSPQVVEFLSHLKRHIKNKLLVIWDRSKTHRSRLVQQFVAGQKGAICIEYLPASPLSSIRRNTSGGTGNTTSFPTSVLRHSPTSAIMPYGPSNACVAVLRSFKLFGTKRSCFRLVPLRHYIL